MRSEHSLARAAHAVLGFVASLGVAGSSRAQATGASPVESAPVEPAPVPAAPPVAPPAAAPAPGAPPSPAAATVSGRPAIDLRRPEECPACPEPEAGEGAGAFFLGFGWFDFATLNRHLRENGYERIASPLTLLGGEGHAVMPSGFIMGARGAAILAPDGSGPDGLRRTFGGGFGMIDLGFALVHTHPLLVSLTSSIGGYGVELGIGDGQTASFDGVLQNPRRSTSLGHGGLLLGLTLGIDGRVPIGEPDLHRGRGFFTLGGRVGVLYGPPLAGWGLAQGGKATDGPSPTLAGFYAALAVGFGGGREAAHR